MTVISASWPDSEHNINAFTTTRGDGASIGPYQGLNLGLHVGDDEDAVATNRQLLLSYCQLADAQWLDQVHSTICIQAQRDQKLVTADACWSDQANLGCIVMTADCLPVAFRQGKRIAVAHAGWRGLVNGVLENTLTLFEPTHTDIWLGPAIGAQVFEVGSEVREQFVDSQANTITAFVPSINAGKWLADIYQLARLRLVAAGVPLARIYGGNHCTFTEQSQFYSYRKQAVTGRMATVIYRS
jgi:YfiH family protein